MIFSVDGVSQESYEKYRAGGDFQRVKEGIRNIVEAKKKLNSKYPVVVMQFIVFRHNEDQVGDIKVLARELGADKLEIKTAQLNGFGNMEPPEQKKYSRYQGNKRTIKGEMTNSCWRQWHSAVVTWDGKVAPCCYDKDAEYSFGNVRHQKLDDILLSKESIAFKMQVADDKRKISICHNCPEGRK